MKDFFVSVIVPCRNEKDYIKKLIESVTSQDYPKDKMEFLIVNGASSDGTREIIEEYRKKYPYITLLENPKVYTPFGLNIAIKRSKGDIIIRLDSHAFYEKDYVSKCVKYLHEYKADDVGGVIKTIPAKNTLVARSIAICLGHGLGIGNSHFRKGAKKVMEVDTVFGGCYKKEVFDKIGLFNEKLIRSQDLEFNLRLKRAGGKIMLVPDIVSYYYPKSTFREFFIHNYMDGQWAILPLKFTRHFFKLRHYVPLFCMLFLLLLLISSFFSLIALMVLLFVLAFYVLLILFFSITIALAEKDIRYVWSMPIAFFIRNLGYGFGEVVGLTMVFDSAKIKV